LVVRLMSFVNGYFVQKKIVNEYMLLF
jgi:hypothetical protein